MTHCVGLAPLLTADMGDRDMQCCRQTSIMCHAVTDDMEQRNIEMRDLINS